MRFVIVLINEHDDDDVMILTIQVVGGFGEGIWQKLPLCS